MAAKDANALMHGTRRHGSSEAQSKEEGTCRLALVSSRLALVVVQRDPLLRTYKKVFFYSRVNGPLKGVSFGLSFLLTYDFPRLYSLI